MSITVSCAKTDEPTEMPFSVWTWVGPGNHVLGMGPRPQGEGAILRGALLRAALYQITYHLFINRPFRSSGNCIPDSTAMDR